MLAVLAGVWLPAEASTPGLSKSRLTLDGEIQLQLELSFDQPVTSFVDRLKYQPNQLCLYLFTLRT